LNLAGAIRFARGKGTDGAITSDWNLNFNTLQGRSDSGIVLDQINGGVSIVGGFDGRRFYSRGTLDLDSLLYEGFQFTQIQGPLWMNEKVLLFGALAEHPRPGQRPRRLSARFYGGTLVGDGRIDHSDITRYTLSAQMVDAELNSFAVEKIPKGRGLRGKVAGSLQLSGSSRGPHTLKGVGKLSLRDGDLYELPLVLSLLKILSIRQPDSSAFNTCEIEFQLDGTHILFNKFNFLGDAISLLGKGEMDFDRNLRMIFHAILGNDQLQIPLISPLTNTVSKQLMLLYVYGTLDDPKTTREALPAVRRAVQEIQGEPPDDPDFFKQTTDWLQELLPR
ncbi:MAG: AsmA-like C-terminal region-containing protein, partial [Planctomycetales bacterium]